MEKIIVSFTSWTDRLELAANVIEYMLAQTLQPDEIMLNLSLEEFPNKEAQLPQHLVDVVNNNDKVVINWCEGNDMVFMKLIPAIKKYYKQDVLIATIDDDFIYRNDYLETLYNKFKEANVDKFCLDVIPDNGSREMYRCNAFEEDFWTRVSPQMIKIKIDDVYYRMYLEKYGKQARHLTQTGKNNLRKTREESPLL